MHQFVNQCIYIHVRIHVYVYMYVFLLYIHYIISSVSMTSFADCWQTQPWLSINQTVVVDSLITGSLAILHAIYIYTCIYMCMYIVYCSEWVILIDDCFVLLVQMCVFLFANTWPTSSKTNSLNYIFYYLIWVVRTMLCTFR